LVSTLAQIEKVKELAETSGGIFRTADLTVLGVTPYQVRKLVAEHVIERVKPGYYCLYSAQESMSEAKQIAQLFPDGVLCMYTALLYYRYSDRTPLEWDIAVDKDTSKSRFKLGLPLCSAILHEAGTAEIWSDRGRIQGLQTSNF
jgi:predicted transcriptional regulator of viral defense system